MKCEYCERHCLLDEGQSGYCQMYALEAGRVVERYPNRYSSVFVSHIEAIPFYHYQPGSRSLVVGTAGCNFDCHYCSNAYVARSEPAALLVYDLAPERVVTMAKQTGCHNIVFAVNEPTVSFPTMVALARAARQAGIPAGVLTNGFASPETTEIMGREFSFVNISLKSMSDSFYQSYVGVASAEPVKRAIASLWRLAHAEISTPIVQGVNDGEIPEMASFIASIDREIPWHVFRLLPEYKMADANRTSVDLVNAALETARAVLPYIYFGNFVGSRWVSTNCPSCGVTGIERINLGGCGAKLSNYRVRDGRCAECGQRIPVGPLVDWNSNEVAACM